MAKIAVDSGRADSKEIAQGAGWSVADVICTSGPQDRPVEEQHAGFCIAVVLEGSFQYRSAAGREMMTPGSLLLGSPGQYFECSHEHAVGDRCISFRYEPEYFEGILADTGLRGGQPFLRALRVPPLRLLAGPVAQAAATEGIAEARWEELGVQLAVKAATAAGVCRSGPAAIVSSAEARVTRAVRKIEHEAYGRLRLGELAREAGLSRYHFLRTFEQLTGVTPHQYLIRTRLRNAATRLAAEPTRVLDIALDCGFGDVSHFNHAFRAEFGVAPLVYRRERGQLTRSAG